MTVAVILAQKGHDVITVQPAQSMGDVCRILENRGVGAIVISSGDGRVDGILSERDLVRAIAREGGGILERPVSDFMTTKVVSCTLEDTITDMMGRMTEGKFRHLPVVDEGRLVGIVSIGDLVKQRIAEAEAESQAMREYITTG